jgi:hypothetical protein
MHQHAQKRRQALHKRGNNTHANNTNTNSTSNNNNAKKPIVQTLTIQDISQFTKHKPQTSLEYPIPRRYVEPVEPNFDLPEQPSRAASLLSREAKLLGSTFAETSNGQSRSLLDDPNGQELSAIDSRNPLLAIIIQKRSNAQVLKLGSNVVDIFAKEGGQVVIPVNPPVIKAVPNKRFNNLLVQDGSLHTTPAKRIRGEVIDASSSMKKNRRTLELSGGGAAAGNNDTTMELSFEGKAMDRSDLVKLVDSSAMMGDDSHSMADVTMNTAIDTKNLLQNTEFQY